MVMAAIPLIASLIPAIGSLFGGGGDDKNKGGGDASLGATHAALGTALASQGGAEHPVLKGTDLPPTLATVLSGKHSGHVLPHAATASGKMGHTGVLAPHLEAALSSIHAKQQTAPVLRHQEKAARAAVRRVQAQVAPHLEALNKHMRERATQIQATAEHRAKVLQDQRWQQVADKQTEIIRKLDRIADKMSHTWRV